MSRPLAVVVIIIVATHCYGGVIYVNHDADGINNGTTWANAFTELQSALGVAEAGDEIWVAAGTYTPAPPNGSRTATFELKDAVGLYGGFRATEAHRDERDPSTHATILSGDLNQDDADVPNAAELANETTRAENSYHVVTASGVDATAVLDGFHRHCR